MDDTTESRAHGGLSALLAGLQAGMVGALWMLAWLGVSAEWQNQGFWNSENLFATAFYGSDAVRSNFGTKTIPGLALYLLIYCLLGGVFALIFRSRARSGRLIAIGILFALGWFYLSFHLIWKSELPLLYLLYSDRPMVLGHLIYGICIGRFQAHYPQKPRESTAIAVETLESPPSTDETPVNGPPLAP
jgi:hypothetical protein